MPYQDYRNKNTKEF